MATRTATSRRRGGAPTKAPGGLDRVLFVRASGDLLDALDALVEKQRAGRPGLSRADVARELLYSAVNKKKSR
jgi:hypothetical protein